MTHLKLIVVCSVLSAVHEGSEATRPEMRLIKEHKQSPTKTWSVEQIASFLDTRMIDTARFKNSKNIIDVLGVITEALKEDQIGFDIILDLKSFDKTHLTDCEIRQARVGLTTSVRRVAIKTALRYVLSQLPTEGADLWLKQGQVLIVSSHGKTKPADTIMDSFVAEGCLEKVLKQLSAATGVNFVIDQRVKEKAKQKVHAKLFNHVSIGGILFVLTDMLDLDYVVVESNLFYITSGSNATKIRKDGRTAQ